MGRGDKCGTVVKDNAFICIVTSISTLPLECITYIWKFYYDIHNPTTVSLKTFIRKNPVGKKN